VIFNVADIAFGSVRSGRQRFSRGLPARGWEGPATHRRLSP
jgi:hypothetical protein